MFKKINETLYKLHLDKIIFSYIRCYIAGILKLSESFKDHVFITILHLNCNYL